MAVSLSTETSLNVQVRNLVSGIVSDMFDRPSLPALALSRELELPDPHLGDRKSVQGGVGGLPSKARRV